MNRGVELLLRRMESNPEEFAERQNRYIDEDDGKWGSLIRDILHRVEVIDRDNGHRDASDGARPCRYGKPLGYLSDEEVLTLLRKLDETRAMLFERRVMRAILEPKAEKPTDAYPTARAPYLTYVSAKGSV